MMDQLRSAPLLSGLEPAQLEHLAQHATRKRLEHGQWLFNQGDPARHFYFVQSGRLRLFRLSPEGVEKVIEIVSPGQTFAEALLFLNIPHYPLCAAALEASEVVAIDSAAFAAMLRESVDTCFALLGSLSRRVRGLIGEIDSLTLHSAKGSIARYLLAHVSDDRLDLRLDALEGVLASRLSLTPEAFSRIIRQLADDGILSIQYAHVRVLKRDALSELAELFDSAMNNN